MLLAIDAGNTNIVFAVFDRKKLMVKWRFSTDPKRTADEYALNVLGLMEMNGIKRSDIKNVIISTVVPRSLFALKSFSREYFSCNPAVIGEDGFKVGIGIKIDKPGEVGADRIVNAYAANKRFKKPCIILDFGTATTFDVVNDKGDYIGGVIAPGINLSLDALKNAAAKLPDIAVKKPEKVVGKSTIPAMQSGIYWGYVGLIEGICKRIKKEYGKDMLVIATGGLATLFFKETDLIDHLEPDLTIEGLNEIFLASEKKR